MQALVEIAGIQFEVSKNDTIKVPLLDGSIGDTVSFDNILLAKSDNDLKIGTPYVEGNVEAKIVEHGRDKKVIVFKKKRRKGYRKLNGHRQNYTVVEITGVNA